MLYASQSDNPIVVVATDTDVLVLLTYAYNEVKPTEHWVMRIDKEKYVYVNNVCNHYGSEVCKALPAYHSITGCDTTSFPFNVGKVKPFKNMVKESNAKLLFKLGENEAVNDTSDAEKFLQTVMYSGKDEESHVETRLRMYERQKVKSSVPLIPDQSSAREHVKRADCQARIWKQCMEENIHYRSPVGMGWGELMGA